MDEELTIDVHHQGPTPVQQSLPEVVNTLLLAGIGALATTRDETEAFMARFKQGSTPLLGDPVSTLQRGGQSITSNVEQFLHRFNIPSKSDIDDISSRVAQLNTNIEELRRSRGDDQK